MTVQEMSDLDTNTSCRLQILDALRAEIVGPEPRGEKRPIKAEGKFELSWDRRPPAFE